MTNSELIECRKFRGGTATPRTPVTPQTPRMFPNLQDNHSLVDSRSGNSSARGSASGPSATRTFEKEDKILSNQIEVDSQKVEHNFEFD